MVLYIGDKPVGLCKIIEKKVPKVKYGISIDNLLGDVDENGVMQKPTVSFVVDGTGVEEIEDYGLDRTFYYNSNIVGMFFKTLKKIGSYGMRNVAIGSNLTELNLSSLTNVGNYGLYYAIKDCKKLTSVSLGSLKVIGANGMNHAFENCTSLVYADLSTIETVEDNGLTGIFYGCSGLSGVSLTSLKTVGKNGLQESFRNCKKITGELTFSSLTSISSLGFYAIFYSCPGITKLFFPVLKDIQNNSFGTSSVSFAFQACIGLTEIHFRADMQATIEAMAGYANKWGAANVTIYYDL